MYEMECEIKDNHRMFVEFHDQIRSVIAENDILREKLENQTNKYAELVARTIDNTHVMDTQEGESLDSAK